MPAPFPLQRNVPALRSGGFDVLVIGGGIYGAWTAYDAAQRGLSVALIERDDWGCGASSASSKLIHGGLRYLEHFEFGLVRHALIERRTLARLAPHLVRPLNFVLPVWKGARVGTFRLSAGLTLYDWLSFGRQPVQRHKHYRRERLLRRYPFLSPDGLHGGFRYGDCQEDDARLTLLVVAAAQGAGAVVANRVTAERLLNDANGVCGATVRDAESGEIFNVPATTVVNATGPWAGLLLGDKRPRMKLVKGTHLVLPAIPDCNSAFLLTAPQDGRVFFVIPWYGRTLLGTTETEVTDPDQAEPALDEERYLLAAANAWLPGLRWSEHDVIARYAGTRALQDTRTTDLNAVTREFTILEPRPRLLMPLGGKFTTARYDASLVVDRLSRVLKHKLPPARTQEIPLPGAPPAGTDWLAEGLRTLVAGGVSGEAAHWLCLRHGTRTGRILELIAERPGLAHRLHPQAPFIGAEAVLAVRDEMARSTEDVLRRRMPLALLVPPQQAVTEAVTALIAPELGRQNAVIPG